ncbi:MAG: alcohol dehydrogenase catalytic domain-containing protein [Betaproteobacteria bacterium]|nr:alcohol dehydrogenase catalytic domain-containing protein [Betaproteobacteria bacterium]
MTAISITRAGGPEVLRSDTRPVPLPEAGQVLIRVAFAGINRRDCEQRRGFRPPEGSDIPGLEVAGEVVATGAGVRRWKPGDRVCAKLGAASAINYREQDFVAGVQRATDGHGADVIIDIVGVGYARRNLEALATDGRGR